MSGPCTGHVCDSCRKCRNGRCCRGDNPYYKLPSEGEWQPFYGRMGVLADDGAKVECHACGEWFGHLGAHVTRAHDITPDEYRAMFGLNAHTGLIGPALAGIRRADLNPVMASNLNGDFLREMTRERRSLISTSRPHRTQERLNKEDLARRVHSSFIATRACAVCGAEWTADTTDLRSRLTCASPDCVRRLLRAKRLKKRTCRVCEREFTSGPGVSRARFTCSPACKREIYRRAQAARPPITRQRMSDAAKLRTIQRNDRGQIVSFIRAPYVATKEEATA